MVACVREWTTQPSSKATRSSCCFGAPCHGTTPPAHCFSVNPVAWRAG
jgi:hypothetical protein